MRTFATTLALLGFAAALSAGESAPSPLPDDVRFETHVRPILKTHCFHCHGEQGHAESKLDLRLARLIVAGGESGPAIVASQPDASLLLKRIVAGEMPPKGKGLTSAETAILRRWIEQGAPTVRPESAEPPNDETWSDEERSWWSLRPVVRPPVPDVPGEPRAAAQVDRFLLHSLKAKGLDFGPEADRGTLARRLAFDLTGLPPKPEDVERFVADSSPDAYERLVDELLASPAFGERWGRHWLDVVGYADSDGYTEEDRVRPWAYRYRDYVVGAWNADKPYDRFLTEQIAGDEMLQPPYQDLAPADEEKLAATGYLRMAPDGAGESGVDETVARNDVVAESIKIVSGSALGLTVGCAQCHDHRYDPISQVDYYRMRAVFEPLYDPVAWRHKSSRVISLWTAAEREAAAKVDSRLATINTWRFNELDCVVMEVFERERMKLAEDKRDLADLARQTPADKRTEEQKQLLKDLPSLNVDRGSVYLYEPQRLDQFNKKYAALDAEANAQRPPERMLACATEPAGHSPATKLFNRGDVRQPKQDVAPGELTVLPDARSIPLDDPNLPTTGRRLEYARRLTSGRHPLVARVIVNRVWMHLFGQGIVATPGDFGRLGEPPSHPELLDWLADEFVADGWSLKRLVRELALSTAYRQSSVRRGELEAVDPDNRLLGRAHVRRLEAESIRDAMLEVSGMRATVIGGAPSLVGPDDVGQIVVGTGERDGNGILIATVKDDPQRFRRSMYVQVRRSMPLGVMEPFDLPALSPNCDRRARSTGAPQALLMMNNANVIELADRMATRVSKETGDDPTAQATRAWRLAYGVDPSAEELAGAVTTMSEIAAEFERRAAATPPPAGAQPPARRALAMICQALLSSNRFLYVD